MRLQLKVDKETGLITDVKFKKYGCRSAIASSSPVTEWVKGKTLDKTSKLRSSKIAEELTFTPVTIHYSILEEAAVKDYKKRH
jgi:NifU-like protein involved in Fe-S cluster formation